MGYASISSFRKLTNINKDIISDDVLFSIFPIADRLINKIISTPVKLEMLQGNINGSNKIFYTEHAPISDVTLKNILAVDSCDIADFDQSTDAIGDALAGSLSNDGGSSISMGKSGTTEAFVTYSKASTSRDGTGRRLKVAVFIRDIQQLVHGNAMEVRIGSASDAYYTKSFRRAELRNGLNEVNILLTDMGTSGTPDISALDYIFIEFNVPTTADTITAGDIKMDNWRLEDIDSPDIADALVYYVTLDANGRKILGSAQAVTSLLRDEGSITMTTAPTTTTAIGGVFCNYSYVSDNMDWELVNPAACYLAAHLVSFIIAGSAPNYRSIEDGFLRRDLAGAPDEWMRICYSLLNEAVGEDATGVGFRLGKVDQVTF
ncbi:hypothetical protein LCGC14_1416120 [marine sediment metagenome]|uniref:Uncharacterized protein n=1 Tax=marine sediment metagenome TaxID=412755 RepID=A0A0F9MUH3_9ZZZZ